MTKPAPAMSPPHVPAIFVADHPALDFMNSLASPDGAPLDWISDGDGLLAWLEQSGLLSRAELREAATRFDRRSLDDAADQARHLRSWLRKAVDLRKKGEKLADTNPLEIALAEAWSRPVFGKAAWSRVWDLRAPGALLGPIAEAIGDLLIAADFDRIRACEGQGCTLWFLDVSKTNRRRWCSMAICGNRAKVAAHRARKRCH